MTRGRIGLLWMAAFVALWAVVEVMAGEILRLYSPYQVVWTRYAVHLSLMLAWWGLRDSASLWRTGRPLFQIGRSLLMLGMPASWVIAMQHGVHQDALMSIFWLSPLLILTLAHVLLGERAPWQVWAAGAIACLGANLLFGHGPLPPLRLMALPVTMALTFSLYVVMTRSLRTEAMRANLFYTAFGVLVALSPAMPPLWVQPTAMHFAVMVGVGVLGFGALLALDRMAATAPVSFTAPAASLQLVFLAGAGWIAGHAHAGGRTWAGLLIITAVAMYLWGCEPALQLRRSAAGATAFTPGAGD